ncbi:hypothetical protein BOTBODRAFT_106335 [Botryobasidium botryosum FD-172 SS1]|uniref:Uncharacterized protein n=1 Tax=Botryobasidium botryosum (strain FD-172 SS1) TaxID=930990 RepID=A0A067MZV8_BOTB1|nr:hypothetical protein BOTBODRAFT_106335 [Botryobasidium botryosum FD-172 SS1]
MAAPPPPRPYAQALAALSARTKTPLPSLVASFAILHELTAIVPLVGFFFCARAGGVGERVVHAVRTHTDVAATGDQQGESERSWATIKAREWLDDGERWAGRVGRRYGIWGFEKGAAVDPSNQEVGVKVAGDVANAVLAYGLTKAILPVRIGLSLYLAPAFSRSAVEPTRQVLVRTFFRNRGKMNGRGPPDLPPSSTS